MKWRLKKNTKNKTKCWFFEKIDKIDTFSQINKKEEKEKTPIRRYHFCEGHCDFYGDCIESIDYFWSYGHFHNINSAHL
jgi:hypothetical protein